MIGLAGCSGDDDNTNDDNTNDDNTNDDNTNGTTQSAGETFSLGLITPQSGPFESTRAQQRVAHNIALDMFEESGGLGDYELQVVRGDDETNPEAGTRAARDIAPQVDLFGNTSVSSVALAMSSVANETETPFFALGASPPLTGSECNQYTFATNPSSPMVATGMANYTIDNLGTDVYHLTHNYEAGKTYQSFAADVIANRGGTNVGQALVDLGQGDMSSAITRAGSSGANVLMTHVFVGDQVTLFKQMSEFRTFSQFEHVVVNAVDNPSVYSLDQSVVQNLHGNANWWWTADNPATESFVIEFINRTGDPPGQVAGISWASLLSTLKRLSELDDPTVTSDIVDTMSGMQWTENIFGENRSVRQRECDHRASTWLPILKGKAAADQESVYGADAQFDAFEILEYSDPAQTMRSCEETSCSL
jgi:branched-chain amino acid transport system substrate-binding protein